MKDTLEELTPDELCFYAFMRDCIILRGYPKNLTLDIMLEYVPEDSELRERLNYIYDNFI